MTTPAPLSAALPGRHDDRFGALSRRLTVTSYATPPLWCVEITSHYPNRTPVNERCHDALDYTDAVRVAQEWAAQEGAELREEPTRCQ